MISKVMKFGLEPDRRISLRPGKIQRAPTSR
jgi:hypothetical protein